MNRKSSKNFRFRLFSAILLVSTLLIDLSFMGYGLIARAQEADTISSSVSLASTDDFVITVQTDTAQSLAEQLEALALGSEPTLVKDINPEGGDSWPGSLTNVNGTLYFRADDGTHAEELWKSDGTAAGTVMVKDINPGSGWSEPWHLTDVNGTLYFGAIDGTHGAELWKSDGTASRDCHGQGYQPRGGMVGCNGSHRRERHPVFPSR